jgi:hypothetical protein
MTWWGARVSRSKRAAGTFTMMERAPVPARSVERSSAVVEEST